MLLSFYLTLGKSSGISSQVGSKKKCSHHSILHCFGSTNLTFCLSTDPCWFQLWLLLYLLVLSFSRSENVSTFVSTMKHRCMVKTWYMSACCSCVVYIHSCSMMNVSGLLVMPHVFHWGLKKSECSSSSAALSPSSSRHKFRVSPGNWNAPVSCCSF